MKATFGTPAEFLLKINESELYSYSENVFDDEGKEEVEITDVNDETVTLVNDESVDINEDRLEDLQAKSSTQFAENLRGDSQV